MSFVPPPENRDAYWVVADALHAQRDVVETELRRRINQRRVPLRRILRGLEPPRPLSEVLVGMAAASSALGTVTVLALVKAGVYDGAAVAALATTTVMAGSKRHRRNYAAERTLSQSLERIGADEQSIRSFVSEATDTEVAVWDAVAHPSARLEKAWAEENELVDMMRRLQLDAEDPLGQFTPDQHQIYREALVPQSSLSL